MYVYYCNSVLTAAIYNRSDKEMIQAFKELTEYLKSRRINPVFHLMDNEASTDLKMTVTTM